MKELDILQDILAYRISGQLKYNSKMIHIRNPEARQIFTQLRDDEMRSIVKLQQKVEGIKEAPFIPSKIFPSRVRL